jgi:hypothetical protein
MQWESHNRFVPIENGQRTDDAFASLEDDTIRRNLLSQVVHHACERNSHPDFYIIYQDIAKPADFDWILIKLNHPDSHSCEEDEMWAKFLRGGFDIANFNHVNAVLTSSQVNNTVRAADEQKFEQLISDEIASEMQIIQQKQNKGYSDQLSQEIDLLTKYMENIDYIDRQIIFTLEQNQIVENNLPSEDKIKLLYIRRYR